MTYIAVMDMECGEGIKADVCRALTDVIVDELVKAGRYTVIDRTNRDKILAEQGFQQTGCVDSSCSIEVGRLLGVGRMVVGSLTLVGSTYLINLQMLNVETATVESSARRMCKCELDGLIDSIALATNELLGATSAVVPPPPVGQTPSAEIVLQFFQLTRGRDYAATTELLKKYPSLISATEKANGSTALTEAAWSGDLKMAEILLQYGSNPNYHRSSDNITPLACAAAQGHDEVIRLLVAKGAVVNEGWGENLNSALFDAAWWGRKEAALTLLELGAEVDYRNKIGQTALMYAAARGNVEVAGILLDKGADINAMRTEDNCTPLCDAVWWQKKEMFIYLVSRGGNINHKTKTGKTLLHYAASTGSTEIAEMLIARGLDPNAVESDYGNPPLFDAAWAGKVDMMRFLLDKGADLKYRNKLGQNALMYAAGGGNIEAAKFLLAHGLDIDAERNDGTTALSDAVWWKKTDMVVFLLKKGANVNHRNKLGETPIWFAVCAGDAGIVEILLKKGAKPNFQTNTGESPLKRAEREGFTSIVELLKKYGAK